MCPAFHDDLDPATLARLRKGDVKALGACYRRFGQRVYRVCFGMLSQASDAEDATHKVFVKVHERAGQFAGRARFTTWLHRIAVNHCLQKLERDRRRPGEEDCPVTLVDPGPSPVREAEGREAARRAAVLLSRLPPAQRAVLVLRELGQLSYEEIADALDVPVGTVMSRLARARARVVSLTSNDTGAGHEPDGTTREPELPPSRSAS